MSELDVARASARVAGDALREVQRDNAALLASLGVCIDLLKNDFITPSKYPQFREAVALHKRLTGGDNEAEREDA